MKNVLFLHSSAELYGSDRSLLNIISNMDTNKYTIFVVLPSEGELTEALRKLPHVKVFIFEVAVLRRKELSIKGTLGYLGNFRKSLRYLSKLIQKNHISIVYTNTAVVFPGAIAAKKCGIKSIWHVREIIKNPFENKVISFVINRYSDAIIVNSKATGEALRGPVKHKYKVVYNAIEVEEKVPNEIHEGLVVGMAGRINRWKGQSLFVGAAEIVHEAFPDVKFQIAGDCYSGEEFLKEELIKKIHAKGLENTVILMGQVKKMNEFYQGIDVFVLPSIQPEPFGLVVIEAMGYGVPVIATNHGGPREIIKDGEIGFLVDFHQPDEMAKRIMELLREKDLRERIGEKGRQYMKKRFSINYMVAQIEKIMESVLS